jgi:thiamine monophosphate kinase
VADGTWSLTFHPKASAHYRASYAATSNLAAADSETVHLTVHSRIAVNHVSSTAPAGRAIVISGRVAPAAAGLEVTLHKIVDGAESRIAKVSTDSTGRWTARLHMRKGKHHLFASVPARHGLAAGKSRVLTLHRS